MRLLSLAAFALVVLGSDSGTDVSPKDEWSQFRGNITRTGRSAAEVVDGQHETVAAPRFRHDRGHYIPSIRPALAAPAAKGL